MMGGQERSKSEAEMIARRIQNLIKTENKEIYWDECKRKLSSPRPAHYSDVAILLQRRTNLRYLSELFKNTAYPIMSALDWVFMNDRKSSICLIY